MSENEKIEPLLPQPEKKHYFGLACTTTAALTFGAVSILVKLADLPSPLMLQIRSLTQWLMSLVVILSRLRGMDSGFVDIMFAPAGNRALLVLRAFMYWGFMMLWWAALVHIPPGDAVAIVYCSPMISAIFASILLREPINSAVTCCMILATAGVVLIIQPSFLCKGAPATSNYVTGVCLAGGSAVLAALQPLAVRKSASVHWSTVEHITAFLSSYFFTPAFLLSWLDSPINGEGNAFEQLVELAAPGGLLRSWRSLVVILIACVEFCGLALQTIGYQNVESTAAAGVMNYLEVPFVFFLQAGLFDEVADAVKIVGVVLIITSGVVNTFHKQIFALLQQ